jgi:threonyl-tRNA synthetase
LQKVPYAIVVGDKEQSAGNINVRSRATGELGAMELQTFFDGIAEERKPGGKPNLGVKAS